MEELEKLILKAVSFKIEEEIKKQIEIAKEKLESEIEKIVSDISIEISKHISFERYGTDLIIHIFTNLPKKEI